MWSLPSDNFHRSFGNRRSVERRRNAPSATPGQSAAPAAANAIAVSAASSRGRAASAPAPHPPSGSGPAWWDAGVTATDRTWLDRAERWAHLLDTAWAVPGTRVRFGIDTLLGLIPGVGDFTTLIMSLYLLWEAQRRGASGGLMLRMTANVVIDALVGSIPIVGDLFDVGWKANRRNVRLLKREFLKQPPA